MAKMNVEELEKLNLLSMSSETLKKHLMKMITNSSQCRAILESINQDTGEYRIVLHGTLENHNHN